jgi:hypothetical protein
MPSYIDRPHEGVRLLANPPSILLSLLRKKVTSAQEGIEVAALPASRLWHFSKMGPVREELKRS